MKIAIIGSGYVGLVTGTCFAESGNHVICVDNNADKINKLNAGIIPIYEPGLEELIKKNVSASRLKFTTDLRTSVQTSDIIFIAVGTPPNENGEADLQYVLDAARDIALAMNHPIVIVNKSTVPVGTADLVIDKVSSITKIDFEVVSNPEFLKEGSAIDDFMKPDRVVIGTESENAREIMAALYAPFVRTENPIIFMDPCSSELTKYAANSMLALRISFMNDIARLCDRVGADINSIRKGIGSDSRIGYPFLFPGVGYGGSCFPKDVRALISTAKNSGLDFDLLRAVERINESQKTLLVDKIIREINQSDLSGKIFTVWGLAFKPKTDDMREAPSIKIIEGLLGKGAQVRVHDPVAMDVARSILGDRVAYYDDMYNSLIDADGLCLVTEWNEYRSPDWDRIIPIVNQDFAIFDGRNIYSDDTITYLNLKFREQNKFFIYRCIGRPFTPFNR